MTRRYETPAAFKQAVEQRLRDAAAGDGVELARARQLLVFDRLLARLAAAFGQRLIVKGGIVVELRLARARTTKDVDVRVDCRPQDVLPRIQEAGRLDLDDFLRFEITPDVHQPAIAVEGMKYQGQRYRARAMLAGKVYGSPFGLDVAFAEPAVGQVDEVQGSDTLAFAGVATSRYRIYPIEAHIAEKVHAYTMPRPHPNSRVKDLPDIALLATVRTIDAALLREAITRTFEARGTHRAPGSLPPPPDGWDVVYERMAAVDRLRWVQLGELVAAVSDFLEPVLAGIDAAWDPSTWTWQRR